MVARRSAWLQTTAALADPGSPTAAAWEARLDAVEDVWELSDEDLWALAPLLYAAAERLADEPPEWAWRRCRRAGRLALQAAARQRRRTTFRRLIELLTPAPAEVQVLMAVMELEPVPEAGLSLVARDLVSALELVRRYGVDEPDIQRRLARSVGGWNDDDLPPLERWLLGQVRQVAAWATLRGGHRAAARALVDRSPVARQSWVGWLAHEQRDGAGEILWRWRNRAFRVARAARLVAPLDLAGDPLDEVAWLTAEVRGWELVVAGVARPPDEVRPAILSRG